MNANKSKYSIVIWKPQSFVSSLPSFCVNNCLPLELVTSYKYLNVILPCKFSWSPHIQAICSKARKVIGFIHCTFYNHCTFQTLVKTLCHFCITYCSSVRDSPTHSINVLLLEKSSAVCAIKCAPKMVCKLCLPPFLLSASLPFCKAITLQSYPSFQIFTQLTYLPPSLLHLADTPIKDLRLYHPLSLPTDFPHTTAGSSSFSPSASKLWNSLAHHLKETTICPLLRH